MPELHFQDFPGPAGAPPLVVAHGLFGSGVNWRGVARRLSGGRRVLAPDLRNHGRSFHHEAVDYAAMARDILDTLDAQGIHRADLLGHSMGGKAAMVAALTRPEAVAHLVVVDIAPAAYTHSHASLIEALMDVDVAAAGSRGEVDSALKASIPDPMTRQFLLQSLEKAEAGYRWRLNLKALRQGMSDLTGFPQLEGHTFEGPALFVNGAESEYLQPGHRPCIESYFPNVRYFTVESAGHWVHVEQPDALIERVEAFVGS